MKTKTIVIASVLFAVMILSGATMDRYAAGMFSERHSLNSSSALLDILGEVRYTAAAMLWMKTDYYHHEYEFSGKPLSQNEAIMPLIRLITLLDPHFVQAYDFGAYHLAVDLKRHKESMQFLEEGLANNPNSFDLNWEYGFLKYRDEDYKTALKYLLKARENRAQRTPVYSDWIKVVWVNSRICDCLKKLGLEKSKEYLYIEEEMNKFIELDNVAHPLSEKERGNINMNKE